MGRRLRMVATCTSAGVMATASTGPAATPASRAFILLYHDWSIVAASSPLKGVRRRMGVFGTLKEPETVAASEYAAAGACLLWSVSAHCGSVAAAVPLSLETSSCGLSDE
eukprot:CAMPEP_0178439746 /NCGR_PEP_ID=MMETSP0689_2-20121128/36342_1 /TAXON_ID=160604 /ORGANISM="Amphidinium massartii, Strain CS-259" /LENGTH=109 /DNA_ID=CAMNT_0020062339 /DNA_START=143 /DNA_END=469 /DNA_ORIENTATION=+